ncbi:MAG: hypothetical protein F4X77_04540 [Acidobacteriia bacterium]|nr:hypothetical protein [Terriglobia bacterium]
MAIIDTNPRRDAEKNQELKREPLARRSSGQIMPQAWRNRERSTVERVNTRLKDEFGGRRVRVRLHAKVLCYRMSGIVALTVDQLMRLTLRAQDRQAATNQASRTRNGRDKGTAPGCGIGQAEFAHSWATLILIIKSSDLTIL